MRGPLSTQFHDFDPAVDATELAWYGERLPMAPTLCLQPMCGSGRLLRALLAADSRIHGVDASARQLDRCRARLAANALDTTLFRQDVTRLNLPLRYGAGFIANGAFQWITDAPSARNALRRLRAHLVDPGLLLLDLVVPEIAQRRPGAPLVEVRRKTLDDGSDIALRSETTVDGEARQITIRSRYEHRISRTATAREDETLRLTWYEEDDIAHLLADAGYVDIRMEAPPSPAMQGRRFAVRAVAN
jgi:hypothetical protein